MHEEIREEPTRPEKKRQRPPGTAHNLRVGVRSRQHRKSVKIVVNGRSHMRCRSCFLPFVNGEGIIPKTMEAKSTPSAHVGNPPPLAEMPNKNNKHYSYYFF